MRSTAWRNERSKTYSVVLMGGAVPVLGGFGSKMGIILDGERVGANNKLGHRTNI